VSGRPGRTAHRPLFSCQRTSHSATLGRNPRFLLRIITAKARSSSGVAARSGHSTYRLVLPEDTNEEKFLTDWVRLGELGCTYERATRRYVAIDVPPHADIYAVYQVLEEGERTCQWEFEEGHCGHLEPKPRSQ
jgi:hypothetical protein